MKSHSDVIRDLGGYLAVADALGLPKGTVSAMQTRSSIPSEHWPGIAAEAARQGKSEITVELLAMSQPPRKRRTVSAAEAAS